jgi:hypothetical protein
VLRKYPRALFKEFEAKLLGRAVKVYFYCSSWLIFHLAFMDPKTDQIVFRVDIRMEDPTIASYFKRVAAVIREGSSPQSTSTRNEGFSTYITNFDRNNSMINVNKLKKNFDNWIDLQSLRLKTSFERETESSSQTNVDQKESEPSFQQLIQEVTGSVVEIVEKHYADAKMTAEAQKFIQKDHDLYVCMRIGENFHMVTIYEYTDNMEESKVNMGVHLKFTSKCKFFDPKMV